MQNRKPTDNPSIFNIRIFKGDDYILPIKLVDHLNNPINLTGYTGLSEIRTPSLEFVAQFDLLFNEPRSSPQNLGRFTLSLSNVVTRQMDVGRYMYDLKLQDPQGVRLTYLSGWLTVVQNITNMNP